MNKKLLVALICMQSLSAHNSMIEFRGAGFIPTSNVYKHIYHSSGAFGAELTTHLWDCIYGFFSFDYTSKHGRSIGGDTKTKVNFLPLSFGLKYLHPFCYGDLYIGGGAVAARVHTHDYSPFVAPTYTHWGWGGTIKAGCLIDVTECAFLDIFVNYVSIKSSSHNTFNNLVVPQTVKVAGVFIGAGIGYRF